MIASQLLSGQGLGNQLWTIYSTRGIAKQNNMPFKIRGAANFKCRGYLKPVLHSPDVEIAAHEGREKHLQNWIQEEQSFHPESGLNITDFEPRYFSLSPDTHIEGYFQSTKYLIPRNEIIQEIGPERTSFDGCTVNIRGGEYRNLPRILLKEAFYRRAVDYLMEAHGVRKFRIVTDDAKFASALLPGLPIISSGGVKRLPFLPYIHPKPQKIFLDFRAIQESRFQVLSNSTFSWWGAYSSAAEIVIAPKYWMGHVEDSCYWSTPGSYVQDWHWLDSRGKISRDYLT